MPAEGPAHAGSQRAGIPCLPCPARLAPQRTRVAPGIDHLGCAAADAAAAREVDDLTLAQLARLLIAALPARRAEHGLRHAVHQLEAGRLVRALAARCGGGARRAGGHEAAEARGAMQGPSCLLASSNPGPGLPPHPLQQRPAPSAPLFARQRTFFAIHQGCAYQASGTPLAVVKQPPLMGSALAPGGASVLHMGRAWPCVRQHRWRGVLGTASSRIAYSAAPPACLAAPHGCCTTLAPPRPSTHVDGAGLAARYALQRLGAGSLCAMRAVAVAAGGRIIAG